MSYLANIYSTNIQFTFIVFILFIYNYYRPESKSKPLVGKKNLHFFYFKIRLKLDFFVCLFDVQIKLSTVLLLFAFLKTRNKLCLFRYKQMCAFLVFEAD